MLSPYIMSHSPHRTPMRRVLSASLTDKKTEARGNTCLHCTMLSTPMQERLTAICHWGGGSAERDLGVLTPL